MKVHKLWSVEWREEDRDKMMDQRQYFTNKALAHAMTVSVRLKNKTLVAVFEITAIEQSRELIAMAGLKEKEN